jgi:hypothetical protein
MSWRWSFWARALGPYFGTGLHVWGAVIALVMLALSIGYLAGGQLSLRRPSLRGLALLLFVSVLTALPSAFAAQPMLTAVYERVEGPRYGALLGALALFFAPVAIAGAVSPYSIRLLVDALGTSGRVAGRVFFVSTIGSTLRTLLTSFHLVLWFDLDRIVEGLCAITASVAVAAYLIGREERDARA